MSDYTPTMNYPWTTDSPSIDSDDEETQDCIGVPSGAGIRGYQTCYPEPYWDKRLLPLLYEELSNPSTHCDADMWHSWRSTPPSSLQLPSIRKIGRLFSTPSSGRYSTLVRGEDELNSRRLIYFME